MIVFVKACLCALATLACFALSRVLVIPPMLPSGLTAWGCLCFLFSRELSGETRRIRDGIEMKPALQKMWMAAGLLCLLMAVGVLFFQM